MKKQLIIMALCTFCVLLRAEEKRTFVHPGILHTQESLDYLKQKINAKEIPWVQSYTVFRNLHHSSKDYIMYGGDEIATRDAAYNTSGRNHKNALESDSYAIYCQALMYKLTDNAEYADKAVSILNDWSAKLTKVVGADLELTVGFNAYFMVCGAELMMDYEGWILEDQERAKTMFREIWYPHIKGIERVNGQGTWDSASAKCVMAMAVYLEDWDMFDSAYDYFFNGAGNGTVENYFIETGQSQESGRKQGYAQLGLANFEEWCEIAYNQGYSELWDARDNIIAASFEYHAKYNLGEEVPFTTIIGKYGGTTFTSISSDGRGDFKPVYYMAYNHFHNRRGLEMPYTKRVIEEKQPYETTHATITDGAGWGTLFFNNPDQEIISSIEVSETGSNNFQIYAGRDRIVIEECEKEQVEIYDLLSRRVYKSIPLKNTLEITISKGIYVVKIGNSFVRKVVVG